MVVVRHLACGALAGGMVAAGFARRAIQRLGRQDTILSLYFHNPSRMLFARCIAWLRANGFRIIPERTLIEILRGRAPFPRRTAWVSLDDGYREWMDGVLPVVKEQRVPITLFIPSGIVSGDGLFPWLRRKNETIQATRREAMTVVELTSMASCEEVSIGGHTVTHPILPECSESKLAHETISCRRSLNDWTGREVVSFAFPAGQRDGRGGSLLSEAGYQIAATTEPRFIVPGTNPYAIPRVCIPDGITFQEAVCRMTGIWDPVTCSIKSVLRSVGIRAFRNGGCRTGATRRGVNAV